MEGYGAPPVLLGAHGPLMTRTAAEVADGRLVMPFHSHRHSRERTPPVRGLPHPRYWSAHALMMRAARWAWPSRVSRWSEPSSAMKLRG